MVDYSAMVSWRSSSPTGAYHRFGPRVIMSSGAQKIGQNHRCVRAFGFAGDSFGRSLGDDAASSGAAFRAQVEDPVGIGDHIEVVLDHDHCITRIDQTMQDGAVIKVIGVGGR